MKLIGEALQNSDEASRNKLATENVNFEFSTGDQAMAFEIPIWKVLARKLNETYRRRTRSAANYENRQENFCRNWRAEWDLLWRALPEPIN